MDEPTVNSYNPTDYFNSSPSAGSFTLEQCQDRRISTFLVFSILPAVSIIINVITLVALILNRHKLRQNNVYYHVGNTLLTNVIFSLLSLYQILNLFFALDSDRRPHRHGMVRDDIRIWWALYRAMLTAIFLVMCCNIGVLVSAIRDTTHGPLLFGSRALELSSNDHWTMNHGRKLAKMLSRFDRKRRHRRAWLLIFVMWILPLFYVLSAPIGWSCSSTCNCLSAASIRHRINSGFVIVSNGQIVLMQEFKITIVLLFTLLIYALRCYHKSELDTLKERDCSRVWPPMRYDWLLVGVIAWLLCVIVVIAILWRAIRDTKRHFLFCRDRVSRYSISTTAEPSAEGSSQSSDIPPEAMMYVKSPRHNSLVKSHQVLGRTLNSLRYLIWITVLFVVCTAPVMALIIVDYFSDTNPSMVLGNGCLCVPFAYCWICPFLLSRCLPGIRSALRALLLRICKRQNPSKRSPAASKQTSKIAAVVK